MNTEALDLVHPVRGMCHQTQLYNKYLIALSGEMEDITHIIMCEVLQLIIILDI